MMDGIFDVHWEIPPELECINIKDIHMERI